MAKQRDEAPLEDLPEFNDRPDQADLDRMNAYVANEPVEYELINDRGVQPDFDKDTLVNQRCLFYGISAEPEDFELGPVYFVKLLRPIDTRDMEPWGVIFPASSPVVRKVQKQVRFNQVPFHATLIRRPSKVKGHNPYWDLK